MAVCSRCGGFLKIMVQSPNGCGIQQVDCPCTQSETPGREANQHTFNYPPEVLQALRQAGDLRNQALATSAAVSSQHPGSG